MFRCRPHFHVFDVTKAKFRGTSYSYTPLQVANTYGGIPAGLDGSGTTIGIVELGGAYSKSDFDSGMKVYGYKAGQYNYPTIVGTMSSDPGGANVEVMLDILIIAALAPKAKIRVYFMPNTGTGIAQGIDQAVADGCDVVSLSWGADEPSWASSDISTTETSLANAVNKNVPVNCSVGDNGASDGGTGNNVDYPGSSPSSTSCGGTYLVIGSDGKIVSETVWDDDPSSSATGGGLSTLFSSPAYQAGFTIVKGRRGVPDVAGNADPNSGFIIYADGQQQVVGGTSAVSPFWSAIHALMVQKNGGRFAWPNPMYYQNAQAFRDITDGSNGAFTAMPGYDLCSGMGSPNLPVLFSLVGSVTPPPAPPSPPSPPSPPNPYPPIPTPPVCWNRMEAHLGLRRGELAGGLRDLIPLIHLAKELVPIAEKLLPLIKELNHFLDNGK